MPPLRMIFKRLADYQEMLALRLLRSPPGIPLANTLYKAGVGVGFDVPMDASIATPTIRPILDAAQGGIAAGAAEGPHEIGEASEPAFKNSWVNFNAATSAKASFRKTATGMVDVEGFVKSGTVGAVMFTLPAGYRPVTGSCYIPAWSNGAVGAILLEPNGDVYAYVGSNVWFSFKFSFIAKA